MTDQERIEEALRVKITDSCWLWTGCTNNDGYGSIRIGGKNVRAHRVSYYLFKGRIKKGLEIDHICRVRNCINPNHLRQITTKENILAGVGAGAQNARKTHCPQGHEYPPRKPGKDRHCRPCNAKMKRDRYHADPAFKEKTLSRRKRLWATNGY